MRPLTDNCPKPLISVNGKPILEHIVSALPTEIDELVLIVGYLKEHIMVHCGDEYLGRKVTYCAQENFAGGTGDALKYARDVLRGKFMFMYGDDIHGSETLKQAVQEDHAILSTYSDTPEKFGVLVANEDGTLKEILEKPQHPPSNLINIGGFVINTSIFNYDVPVSNVGELYVTDMLTAYAKHNPVKILEQNLWIPLGCPADIEKAEKILAERK
jgi:UDP-N-acetylglucosamine diphosphorylase / glucose-1-phosphate thymidylyltransferase / UDP-N-acetylgalactosamine diphosphorylase / glucosamine-1-phosphate N-acetyltransferase / galactosamine-1-phosphate N-acetyltransferase